MARLFGTDGVRGVAGTELSADLAYSLGRAAVLVLGGERGRVSFVIGRDTRESGEWLEDALVEGIRAGGGDAILTGVVPTPAVAFLTTELSAASGVVISASHNPPQYNGIKFFGADGTKLPDETEDRIEATLDERGIREASPGRVLPAGDAVDRYLEHVAAAAETSLEGMRVVVDCANGAASRFAPDVLRGLGALVHAIFDAPDGGNINVGCGALHPEVVAAEVVRADADAGVAHDGDADRAVFADAGGALVDGDQVLAACAIDLHERGSLPGGTVVTTVMANLGLHRAMEERGITVAATKVGDRYVVEEMRRTGAALGGEQSGHLVFSEHATTGDGILTAVRFLSLARARGISVAELAACMRRFPQAMENVPVDDPRRVDGSEDVRLAVRAAETELGRRGRVLVRASGTEPLVRVMVEAETEEEARRHVEDLVEAVRTGLG